jgi:hypothetical protein
VFDPLSGSCIPLTNIKGAEPVGTLECPEGFILNDLGLCAPEDSTAQASLSVPFVRPEDMPPHLRPRKPEEVNKKVSAARLLQKIREENNDQRIL